MAIFGPIDTGRSVLLQGPSAGQESGSLLIEGDRSLIFARGGKAQTRTVVCNVQAPTAIGGAADHTRAATAYVVQQLREMANNPSWNPVFIQWSSGDGVLTPNPFDGWYRLDSVTPLDWSWERHVPCQVTATFVAPPAPRSMAMAYAGGALASALTGTPRLSIHFPVGSTTLDNAGGGAPRTGAEGVIPGVASPVASPAPILLSTTLANIFKGGVHIYDTLNTGTNPVPTTGGTFVHANWVEVFGTDHLFVGDCVVTNGLQLLLFQAAAGSVLTAYLWNTSLAVANWQQWGTLFYQDSGGSGSLLESYALLRVGAEECALRATVASGAGQVVDITIRLQRGRYAVRVNYRARTQSNTNGNGLYLHHQSSPKILYNDSHAGDNLLAEQLATTTQFGFAAAFSIASAFPLLTGWLYQDAPNFHQPNSNGNNDVGFGETTGPALGVEKAYGLFAVPYGVSGSYSPANLQAEGESGAFGGAAGWSSVADAAASGGNTAKCASGSLTGAINDFGVNFIPTPAAYDVWFRVRVTSAAGAVAEMQLGLFDNNGNVFVASVTLRANQVGTTYSWVRAGNGVTPTAARQMHWRAASTGTLGTDWFIDQAALVPRISASVAPNYSDDQWAEFMYERDTELIVL